MAKNSGRDNVIDTTGLFVYAVASLAVTLSVTKGLCQVEGNCTNCQSLKLHILISVLHSVTVWSCLSNRRSDWVVQPLPDRIATSNVNHDTCLQVKGFLWHQIIRLHLLNMKGLNMMVRRVPSCLYISLYLDRVISNISMLSLYWWNWHWHQSYKLLIRSYISAVDV